MRFFAVIVHEESLCVVLRAARVEEQEAAPATAVLPNFRYSKGDVQALPNLQQRPPQLSSWRPMPLAASDWRQTEGLGLCGAFAVRED